MKTKLTLKFATAWLSLSILILQPLTSFAQGTAFTYQGRLNDGPAPANGIFDLTFTLFNVESGGTAVIGPLTNSAVAVGNGLFTVPVDFGSGVYNGDVLWTEIAVRPAGGGTFATLNPRQQLSPTPHAIFATKAKNLANGAVTSLNNLRDNVTLAAGQNVTITPSGNTLTIASPVGGTGPWQVSGSNTFYNTGNVGVGTTAPATRLHVKGTEEGIRIDGPAVGAPNLAYIAFRDSTGARIGYVGDGSSGDTGVFLASDAGDVGLINAVSGRVLTAKTNGRVGIGTTTPQTALEVHGDVRLGASGELRAPGGEENLRIVRGVIAANGTILRGSGFSVSKPSIGSYDITFNTPFTSPPALTATLDNSSGNALGFVNTVGVTASVAHLGITLGGAPFDQTFHFIAIGPR